MNNYEYIIASLPVLSQDIKSQDKPDTELIISEIRSQLSKSDNEKLSTLLDGLQGDALTEEFYNNLFKGRNSYLKEYFKYDLKIRNAKVKYLNNKLDRPEDQDIFYEVAADEDELSLINSALATQDILGRERAIDDLLWQKIDELSLFNYLDLTAIFSFVSKLSIINRWLKLDEQTGKEMFRKLISEVRGTFKGVTYNE